MQKKLKHVVHFVKLRILTIKTQPMGILCKILFIFMNV